MCVPCSPWSIALRKQETLQPRENWLQRPSRPSLLQYDHQRRSNVFEQHTRRRQHNVGCACSKSSHESNKTSGIRGNKKCPPAFDTHYFTPDTYISDLQKCWTMGLHRPPKWNWTSVHQTTHQTTMVIHTGLHRLPRNMSSHGGETLKISSSFSWGLNLGTALVQRTKMGETNQQNGRFDVVVLYINFNSILLIYHIPIMFCLGETIPDTPPFFFCWKRLSAERKTP